MTSGIPARFSGLSSAAYEHPEDRALLAAVKRIKGLDAVVRFISEHGFERGQYMENISGAIRISPRQYPQLYRLYKEAVVRLDMLEPELFVRHELGINAYAAGSQRPFIVLHAELLDTFNDREVQFILGHELGHVKSGHVLYQSMMRMLANGALRGLRAVPVVGAALELIIQQGAPLALQRWSQKAEYTADRAASLVTLDRDLSVQVAMKLAGAYIKTANYNIEEFLKQAEEFEEISDTWAGRLSNVMNSAAYQSHPYPALRAKALMTWYGSPELRGILSHHAHMESGPALLLPACPHCQAHVPHRLERCPSCDLEVSAERTPPPAFRHHCEYCQWPHDGQDAYCLGCGEKLSRSYFMAANARNTPGQAVIDLTGLPFQNPYFHPDRKPSSSILGGGLGQAVQEVLEPTEQLHYEVLTAPGQALAFTDRRVLVVKAGLAAGGFNARKVIACLWPDVRGMEVRPAAGEQFICLCVQGEAAPALTDASSASRHGRCSQIAPTKLQEVTWLRDHLGAVHQGQAALLASGADLR